MTAEQQIVETLKTKQAELKLGTRAFAELLKVSPALWSLTLSDDRPLGITLADAAARVFPELESLVIIFLRLELPKRNRRLPIGAAVREA